MKTCSKCKQLKDITMFNKKSSNKDGLERYCKECHKLKNKKHYLQNKQDYINSSKKYRKIYLDWFYEIKSSLKCEQCDESHIAVLDFHHKDPNQKDLEVSGLISNRVSREIVLKEISKCIVLCSNCHRKLHYNNRLSV
jgi:hypothetical protein